MSELNRSLITFRRRMLMRALGYASLWGLAAALLVVVAAPWLQPMVGLPLYWITLGLPVLLPLLWVAAAWLRLPDERTIVLAGDAWSGAKGEIVAAWELERNAPGSPFAAPLVNSARQKLSKLRLPEPRWMRKLLVATLLLLAMVPLSRVARGELLPGNGTGGLARANAAEVKPQDATAIEKDAAEAAKQADRIEANGQRQLAEDIAQLARDARAGSKDKEHALREANSLVDRAASQLESRERMERVRESLADSEATQAMAEAIDAADPAALQSSIDEIADKITSDGAFSPELAAEVKEALERAAAEAPQNAELRRAAESAANVLDRSAAEERARREEQARQSMTEQGLDPAAIERALETMRRMDNEALRRALSEFCKACNGGDDGALMDRVQQGELSPEQARALAEAGREMAERLELNAETLREMLQQGGNFEGLEEIARRAFEQSQANGRRRGENASPEWAREQAPEQVQREWEEAAAAGSGGHSPNRRNADSAEVGPSRTAQVDVEGDSGREDDPDAEPQELDPNKAREESTGREASGRDATSRGIGAEDDTDRLPRRFRTAARLYFDR